MVLLRGPGWKTSWRCFRNPINRTGPVMHVKDSDCTARKISGVSILITICCLSIGLFVTACVTTGEVVRQNPTDRVLAENSQMRKRLPLVERENDVLKKENRRYKAKTEQLTATLEKLTGDLADLQEKYQKDMALNEERTSTLQGEYAVLANASADRISELDALYADLEIKRKEEIKGLNEQMAMQKSAFNKEKDAYSQEFAKKESELSGALGQAQSELEAKKLEISALQSSYDEISMKLKDVSVQLEQSKSERNQAESAFLSTKAAYDDLIRKLKKASGELMMNN